MSEALSRLQVGCVYSKLAAGHIFLSLLLYPVHVPFPCSSVTNVELHPPSTSYSVLGLLIANWQIL